MSDDLATSATALLKLTFALTARPAACGLVQRKVVALTLLVGLRSVLAGPVETPASSPSSGPVYADYAAVLRQMGFPRRAAELNLKEGSAVLEFTLRPKGR